MGAPSAGCVVPLVAYLVKRAACIYIIIIIITIYHILNILIYIYILEKSHLSFKIEPSKLLIREISQLGNLSSII